MSTALMLYDPLQFELARCVYSLVSGHRLIHLSEAHVCTRCGRWFEPGLVRYPPCTNPEAQAD